MVQQYTMPGGQQQTPRVQQPAQQYPMRNPNYGMFPNGNVSSVVEDEEDQVPPEHSAAMTLGLLSAGGVNASGGFAAGGGQGLPMEGRGYPASMAGLLNDPLPERTGLTPQYSGPDGVGPGMSGGASPFSQVFGISNMGNPAGQDGVEVDWVSHFLILRVPCWDLKLTQVHRMRGTHTCREQQWTLCKCGR